MNQVAGSELHNGQSVVINTGKKEDKSREEKVLSSLEELRKASDRTLYKAKTVFPFVLFPDTVIVDYQKISIVTREFLNSERVDAINHEDLKNVEVVSGPLFATLLLKTDQFNPPLTVSYLHKNDALKIRNILNGLMTANHAKVHFEDVTNKKKLVKELEQIGSVDISE